MQPRKRARPVHIERPAATPVAPETVNQSRLPWSHLTSQRPYWRADAATLAFQAVSAGAEQLLGYPAAHWIETSQFFTERIHPEDRASILEFYCAAIARGGDASAEYRAVSASGVTSGAARRFAAQTNRSRSITGVITDVTRRKQLEEQLLTAERTSATTGLGRPAGARSE